MLVPYIYYIAEIIDINPFFIIIAFSIIGPVMVSTLKETKGVRLKDDIDEIID